MPNWCSNRIYFKKSERIQTKEDLIALLDSTDFSREYAEALHVLRRAFLLVHSGHIRVDAELYGIPPLCWQTIAGGSLIDLNGPINQTVSELIRVSGYGLSNIDTIRQIRELGLVAELHKYPSVIDKDDVCWQHATMVFNDVVYDYTSHFIRKMTLKEYLVKLPPEFNHDEEMEPDHILHNMGSVIPTPFINEINGFNGKLDKHCLDGYDINVKTYGVKWIFLDMVARIEGDLIYVDFDTPWVSPNERYYDSLSNQMPELESLYYAERGVGFCGSGVAITPGCVAMRSSEMNIHYTDDEMDDIAAIDPPWIIDKVGSYGG